ncbi:MAG TPA: glycoside hydrolase family 2 TIM barrel-domain containing protein, partial [Gemmataceae bacterium]|nr:glycoside hydrolase family 2 TIM barrel-domain containing protein [Gemmataceae bacterium]
MLSLDSSWLFLRQDVAGASAAGFNDSAWTAVTLPHTWNNLDGQDGGNDYYRGTGWYRKYYTVPTNLAGQELFLKFDGANYTTDLYVNGAFVGEHQGGFAAFSWDITPYVTVGATNVFAVKVNNVFNAVAVPLSGDITWDGGLYRHVNLIATDPLHISLTDYASPGVYLQQTNVSSYSANVQVTTKLRNDGTTPRQATVLANILDATGNLVQTLTSYVTISPATGMDVLQNTTMYFPHLWNGRSDPYMYQVAVQVIDGTSGKAVDEVDQPLGLRYFSVDPNQGFYLNGQSLDLHGVGFHQDRLNEGWAISDADQIQDVSLIQDIGATFVRLTLYQHPPLTYSLLDQDGIIAWSDL